MPVGRDSASGNHEPKIAPLCLGFRLPGVVCGSLGLCIPPAQAAADDLFKGKTLTVYVGAPVAGGYDTYGRLLARHIGRHVPGNPTVIVSNMPGGSGINAANFMYNVAPKDGTAIAILIQTMGEEQGLGTEGIRFDVKRFNWIGRVTSNVEMVYVWHTVPVKTIDDVKKRETILASAGPASITYPLLLNDMIGTRFKLVRGYQGTQNTSLAMQRGEVDGATGSIVAVKTLSNWLTSGEINILTQYATKRHRELARHAGRGRADQQARGQGAAVVSGARLRSRACIRCAARRVAGSTFGLAQGVRCDHGRPGVPGGRKENTGGSRPAAGQGPAAGAWSKAWSFPPANRERANAARKAR